MAQAVDIAQKLKLTSIALGCLTRKELCTAFARVNPNTLMTLQNSYNWQSGRSIPRSFSIFEDWATALGIPEGPHFVMSSSMNEFVRVLGEAFSLPDELLKSFGYSSTGIVTEDSSPSVDGSEAMWSGGSLLRGSFLALSMSWSPSQHGRLVCGPMTLETSGTGLSATYREIVLGQTISFLGTGVADGRTCQVMMQCSANGGSFLMAFHLPPLPGNLAGGVFAGSALYDPNSEPTASTIVLLRNHVLSLDQLTDISGYLPAETDAIGSRLENLGYGSDPDQAAERGILGLMLGDGTAPTVTVRRELIAPVASLLDQRRMVVSATQ